MTDNSDLISEQLRQCGLLLLHFQLGLLSAAHFAHRSRLEVQQWLIQFPVLGTVAWAMPAVGQRDAPHPVGIYGHDL